MIQASNSIVTPTKKRERTVRVRKMIRELKKLYPEAYIALRYTNTWELLVAVVLSAQCTDKKVNEVTEKLFLKYRKLHDYVCAKSEEFKQDIHSTGFYRNKTRNILAAAKIVQDEYDGEVPDTMEELLTLPGVARKTANVILSNAFGKHEGIAVDTHVRRFAIRFDLSDYTDPVRIEKDLMEIVPKKEWNTITYLLIEYGRDPCVARKHDCMKHPLTKLYPPAAHIWPKAR